MKSKNRRANKKVKRLCFMRDNQPAAYAEMIRAEVDELFRLAWSGTDFTPGSEAQPLALEKVQEWIERISDPGIRQDLIKALDERTREQIDGQIERSVQVNLMTTPPGAVRGR